MEVIETHHSFHKKQTCWVLKEHIDHNYIWAYFCKDCKKQGYKVVKFKNFISDTYRDKWYNRFIKNLLAIDRGM